MKEVESSGLLGGRVQRQSRQLTSRKCHHRVAVLYLNMKMIESKMDSLSK